MAPMFPPDDSCPMDHALPGGAGYAGALILAADTDNVETGGWCPHCLVPSVLTIPVRVLCEHGWPTNATATPLRLCDECGRQMPVSA